MVDNRHKKSKKVENKKITTTEIFLRKKLGKITIIFSFMSSTHLFIYKINNASN